MTGRTSIIPLMALLVALAPPLAHAVGEDRSAPPADQPSPPPAVRPASDHWAFQPLRDVPVPAVRDAGWPLGPIDRFLLARLEDRGIEPAADADRRTLIRRAYFDLIGLPPPPRAVEAFVCDEAPGAFAAVVDGLLASPRFGERWGRHWLDVARYAESSGGGRALLFPDAWRYRDYVIDALNADKPYDRFILEQLAGDLLPHETRRQRAAQLAATGFLMLGPTNYELQDKELLRMEVVDEQIDTVGRAVLGLTLGCARCHDHKFDPVPTRDYYALAGIFRSTKVLTPGNVSGWIQRELPVGPQRRAELAAHRREVATIEAKIAAATERLKGLGGAGGEGTKSVAASSLPGIVVDDAEATLTGSWSFSANNPRFVGEGYRYAGAGGATARFEIAAPAAGRYELRLAYNAHPNRATAVPVTIHHEGGAAERRISFREKPPIDGLFIPLGVYDLRPGQTIAIVIGTSGIDGFAIADAVQLLPAPGSAPGSLAPGSPGRGAADAEAPESGHSGGPDPGREQALADLRRRIERLEGDLKRLRENAPAPPPTVMAPEEAEDAGDYYICIRGDAHQLGDPVPRGFLSILSRGPPPAIGDDESGRIQLARWLADPQRGAGALTARVMVNRIWHHLFGAGLVRTPDNFGVKGQPPTHGELLDWLAARFIDDGWSIKRTVRRIMLSRAYRLSSAGRSEAPAAAADPTNRLLWRANRRRLGAEAIRDAILAVSGRLDLTAGGRTMRPDTDSEFGYAFRSDRRSVYLPVFRNNLPDLFEVFDFADPNLVTGRRNTSTLPTQALYLMNSPFVLDHARRAAERLLAIEGLSDAQRVELAYAWALGRPPTSTEAELALRHLSAHKAPAQAGRTADRREAWAGLFHALFASIDFRYID